MSSNECSKRRVLIIDDGRPRMLQMMRRKLALEGMAVIAQADAGQAHVEQLGQAVAAMEPAKRLRGLLAEEFDFASSMPRSGKRVAQWKLERNGR